MNVAIYLHNAWLEEVLRGTFAQLGIALTSTELAEVLITDSPAQLYSNLKLGKTVVQLLTKQSPTDFHSAFKPYAHHLKVFDLAPDHGGASEFARYVQGLAGDARQLRLLN